MRIDDNGGAGPNFEPNSAGGPVEDPRYRELPYKVSGDAARYDHSAGNDDFTQAGDLFRLMHPDQQLELITNLPGHMKGIPTHIAKLQIEHFTKADHAYGHGVAKALGMY